MLIKFEKEISKCEDCPYMITHNGKFSESFCIHEDRPKDIFKSYLSQPEEIIPDWCPFKQEPSTDEVVHKS